MLVPAARRRFQRQEVSDEEESEEELCFQYNPDLLPPINLDLDEIDDFLANDIFVQEYLEQNNKS